MNFLQERILKDGVIKPNNVLMVDSFLNHQLDMAMLDRIGRELYNRFADRPITKVLTIETSGIPVACAVARCFGVPMLFAKKGDSVNLDSDVYAAEVETAPHQVSSKVIVSRKFLNENDHVLIVDDFLANGCALQALISIAESADATVEGLGIVVEKGFQEGGYRIRNLGYRLESLAVIESMDEETGEIVFRDESLT